MKELKQYTMARVGLARAGAGIATRELLAFQLAHARARDAVLYPLDVPALLREFDLNGWTGVPARSAAADRAVYLRRPDLGRRLSDSSREALASWPACDDGFDVVFLVADGLSALAVHRHATALLLETFARLDRASWNIAPIVVVERGRVAVGDEIGQLLGAKLTVLAIGERPGLSSPDSLGVYLTWNPKTGKTDAERNCISNIRAEGLSYSAAAARLVFLMNESRRRQISGLGLPVLSACLTPANGS